jgi:hypothetical protein
MSNRKAFLFVGVVCLAISGFAAGGVPEPNNPNLNNDSIANFADFAIMGNNWRQVGIKLAGDLDDSNTVDTNDLIMFCWYWLVEYSEYQQCQGADLDSDGIIAFEDVAKLAQNWLQTGAGLAGDFDDSNSVDYNDLLVMADCWLCGSRPLGIFEQFKTALWNDDLDKALIFIADAEKEKYTIALTQLRPQFQSMVAGMGDLILISMSERIAKYEMLHDEGGGVISSFPVYFCKDEQGEWKIYCF